MNRRFNGPVCVLLVIAGMGATVPAAAQSPSKSYMFQERQLANVCRPPLKFAAGACVRVCPAGYQDMGRTCRFKSMRW